MIEPDISRRVASVGTRLVLILASALFCTIGAAQGRLTLPGGYDSVVYAANLSSQPTALTLDAQNRVFVADISGQIRILIDADHDGIAEAQTVFYANAANHLSMVTDILWIGNKLFVCHLGMVTTLEDTNGDDVADVVTDIVPNIPTGFHQNNGLLQDGPNHILITNGSATDTGPETNPLNAAVLRCDLNGGGLTVYASGLRNTFRLARHPATGDVFGGDNEWNIPIATQTALAGDEINRIVAGGDYGFPALFGIPPAGSPTVPPVVMLPAHVAPTGLAFNPNTSITGYKNELFLTTFTQGTSASVSRVPIWYGPVSNYPSGIAEAFASGFVNPIDVEFLPDGTMLVADFGAYKVYRIFPKSPATLSIEAPACIGTTCPVRLKSAPNPGALVYMGASLAPQPAFVVSPNLTVYLDLSSPVFALSVTPGNGYFNFPIPGNLDAAGEHLASISIPNLPQLIGAEVWLAFAVLDATLQPTAVSPAQSVKILPLW